MNHDYSLETGEKYLLKIEGLPYTLPLPWVWILGKDYDTRIASLNLIGKIKWNTDLGKIIAKKIKDEFSSLEDTVIITVVEKALQLTQVVAEKLNMDDVVVAYNRVKPHMEISNRPVIQVGADSITSGMKFLALYERDINLLATKRNVIIIDDVVTTGGTVLAVLELLDQVSRLKKLSQPIEIKGIFCVAEEGKRKHVFPFPVHSLARLPDPEIRRPGSLK